MKLSLPHTFDQHSEDHQTKRTLVLSLHELQLETEASIGIVPAPQDLNARAVEFLNISCNEKDILRGSAYLHPSMTAYHDGRPAVEEADAFAAGWAQFLQFAPESKMDDEEVIQEGN